SPVRRPRRWPSTKRQALCSSSRRRVWWTACERCYREVMMRETGTTERRQVVVIGAGPSGSIASALLRRRGRDVLVLERQKFPRFSIGESLLVHCLDFVAEAGMIEAVDAAGFQAKNGAAFAWGDKYSDYDFGERFTPGEGRAT